MPRFALRPPTSSLYFDQVSDWVTMGNNFDKENTDAFSLSAWVYWSGTSGVHTIISKQNNASPYNGWQLAIDNTFVLKTIRFSLWNTNASNALQVSTLTSQPIPSNQWIHIVATKSTSKLASGVKIYMNGVQLAQTAPQDTLTATTLNAFSCNIGAVNSTNTQVFNGNITDVRIHNAELTLVQVQDLYYKNIATSVQAYWPFNDAAGTTITEAISGLNGTISGAAWNPLTPRCFGVRKTLHPPTSSLSFDRASDWVTVGNNLDKERTDSFSLSAWVNWDGNFSTAPCIVSKSETVLKGFLWDITNGFLRLILANSYATNALEVRTSIAIPSNKWLHVAVTYNGSSLASGIKFYINGILQATTTTYNVLSSSISNTGAFTIGAKNASNASVWSGNITDVRLHNAELTATQVSDLYYKNIATSVQAYWPFTDAVGTTVTETIGGKNGTISGAAWSNSVPQHFGTRTNTPTRIHVSQRQNLFTYSEDLSNAYWSGGANLTSTYNVTTAPDGTVTADMLDDGLTVGVQHYRNPPAYFITPGYRTASVYLKANTGRYFKLIQSGTSSLAIFDLVGGTITSTLTCTATMESVGNGWYRCSITVLATARVASVFYMMAAATGTDAYAATFTGTNRTYYWWGAQLVRANWPGPYTSTTTTVVDTGNMHNIVT